MSGVTDGGDSDYVKMNCASSAINRCHQQIVNSDCEHSLTVNSPWTPGSVPSGHSRHLCFLETSTPARIVPDQLSTTPAFLTFIFNRSLCLVTERLSATPVLVSIAFTYIVVQEAFRCSVIIDLLTFSAYSHVKYFPKCSFPVPVCNFVYYSDSFWWNVHYSLSAFSLRKLAGWLVKCSNFTLFQTEHESLEYSYKSQGVFAITGAIDCGKTNFHVS